MLVNPSATPTALLMKHAVEVRAEGQTVVLRIGSGEIRWPYRTALDVAQWLRLRGKQAARREGDTARSWAEIARTDEIALPALTEQDLLGLRWRLRAWVRSRLKLNRGGIDVRAAGGLVLLVIGNTTVTLPYEVALQLSQWLRQRGREAKRAAGDHSWRWGSLATLTAANP